MSTFGDPAARRRVLWGTLGLGGLGAAIGLNIAILKNLQPIARHTLTMSANWTIYGLFFLTTREMLLAEQYGKNRDLRLQVSQTRDADKMFSSTMAGMLTGGMLALVVRRTRRAAVSGALFFGAISAVGQLTYTALNHRRQQWIIRKMGYSTTAETEPKPDESMSLAARLRRAVSVDPITWLPAWFPVRRISSPEYRSILQARQEELTFEMRGLRETIASMDQREQVLLQRLNEEQ
ncbi:hypothetical protein GGH19_004556 [Coemansia sp. RSA 1807]|nr:hypothetical protein LPJ58_005492 [Coemansia sp. RSA 1591]KAJ1754248.1 hypothetical protein LPJ69_005489 [Coemansia sp. RSA 1752]KAJ1757822.1 hypothetical protein LPJ54_006519 [Coemansia sp. RSA 1824]KAJ1781676.1 hypothetical protein LPJ67_005393 [Coemansia sp. RSA 1938]KAJ2142932.1 hypothetical protein IW142_004011 [Coemansia sp. RSA 564]KAJ2244442.1 hypothetical protein GGH98_004821 [Coemansia sp. RSA 454]KAJ2405294.1 hypothetical protein J3F80_004279 [Coemansia sp. RSA 2526]KAJ2573303.